jgi:hypothetical protein
MVELPVQSFQLVVGANYKFDFNLALSQQQEKKMAS